MNVPFSASGISAFKDERKRAYLNEAGIDKPLISTIPNTVLDKARIYRIARVREAMRKHDCDAMLMYDPVNIRYAFDSSNMSIWTMHNAARYALVLADGPAIMFEFEGCEHLNAGLPGIDEVRPSVSWQFFSAGDQAHFRLTEWADEIASLVKRGSGAVCLGVDKLEPSGVIALQSRGLTVIDGQDILEMADRKSVV